MGVSTMGVKSAITTVLVLVLVIVGCSGQGRELHNITWGSPFLTATGAALPPPQALASPRQAAAAVLYLEGRDYDTTLAQHVSIVGQDAGFAPQDEGSLPLLETMAYALYRFDVSGKSGAQTLSVVWNGAPPSAATGFIGLGNWGDDCWDWLALPESSEIALDAAQFGIYTKAGTSELICLVGMTGNQSCKLKGLGFELPPPTPQWPMFGHDPQHTFRSDAVGCQSGNLKWTFRTSGFGNTLYEPAVAPDGTIYACDSVYLSAYDPNGDELWRFLPASGPYRGPAVCPDGTIVFTSSMGLSSDLAGFSLYAVNPDGSLKWEFPDVLQVKHAPVVGADNAVYVCPQAGYNGSDYVVAINPDGTKRWSAAYGQGYCPAVAADGTVYVSDYNGLHALNASGSLLWTNAEVKYCDLIMGPDGNVYGYGNFGHVYNVAPAGTTNWDFTYAISTCYPARPAFGAGDMVYVPFFKNGSSGNAALCALTSSGALAWSYETPEGFSAVAVDEAGQICALTYSDDRVDETHVIGFDASGTILWSLAEGAESSSLNGLVALPDGGVLASFYRPGVLRSISPIGAEIWARGAGGGVVLNPVVGADGKVYFGCSDDRLYFVAPDGATHQWFQQSFSRPYAEMQCPAVSSDTVYDTVFDTTAPGPLYALNLDGSVKWTDTPANPGLPSSPIVEPGGLIYFGSGANLWAINSAGVEQWGSLTDLGTRCLSCPAVAQDGTVYAVSSNTDPSSGLFALDAAGADKWQYWFNDHTAYSPAIGADGTIYICAGQLYAINPDGTEKWTYSKAASMIEFTPALAADGTIYVVADPGCIVALNPDGTNKWEYATPGLFCNTPAVDAEGSVYFASTDQNMYSLDASGSLKWKQALDGPGGCAPAIAADGTVYVGSANLLYAFGD